VELVVVTRVHDDGDVGRVDDVDEAAQEAGRADTSGERGQHGGERNATHRAVPVAGVAREHS